MSKFPKIACLKYTQWNVEIATFLGNKFVKSNLLLKDCILSWFHEFFFLWLIVEKYYKMRWRWKFFREINSLVTSLVKTLIWRKKIFIFPKIAFLTTFLHYVWVSETQCTVWKMQKFSLIEELSSKLIWRKKIVAVNFPFSTLWNLLRALYFKKRKWWKFFKKISWNQLVSYYLDLHK